MKAGKKTKPRSKPRLRSKPKLEGKAKLKNKPKPKSLSKPSPPKPAHAHHLRVEDEALLRGLGRFVDDAPLPDQAYACFVRSPHAAARIRSVDLEAARRAPGVLAVLTARDMEGVGSVSRHPPMTGRDGKPLVLPFRGPLATDRVFHVGHAVALVVAETLAAAQDAAELADIDYDQAEAVVDVRAAVAAGAPQVHPDAPGNVALDWPGPVPSEENEREVERIIASAPHVARVSVVNQRLVVATMEPRGGTASYDRAADLYTLRVCSQSPWPLRETLIAIMGLEREQVRVRTDDVGGAFGLKTSVYPEYPALLVAARVTRRPVHWMSTRAEAFLSDQQARDTVIAAELATNRDGRFLALKVRHLANLGAFVGAPGAFIQTNNFSRCFPSVYDIKHVAIGTRCVFTNTVPTGPYRGAGRPEANYVLERVVEEAARLTGLDPAEIRRRNLIPPSAMPYKTAVGTTYDSGQFPAILEKALRLSRHATFAVRRKEAARRGRLRGIGLSCMLEHAGGMPTEGAALLFPGDDTLVVGLGIQSTGQGHHSVYARLAAERLGIPAAQVRVQQGDTNLGVPSSASVASRGTVVVSGAICKTVEVTIEKGRKVAAGLLEAAEADIGYRKGFFEVVGTDRRVGLFEVAREAAKTAGSLDTKATADTPQTFPNGCHVAEVEIDPQTGITKVISYTAVDDCGTVLDHTIVDGQIHGAVAQGLGQALMEHAIYDASGQLVSGTFMDYAMPRADDVAPIIDANHPVPATTNPVGVKGVGEAGTTGALAAIMNAIADAIPGGHGRRLDMPATPEKVWRACRGMA